MKKWIASKIFELALWVDFDATEANARTLTTVWDIVQRLHKHEAEADAPKRKPGRPLGSKDKKPRKRQVAA
jgi:hypothetical protein